MFSHTKRFQYNAKPDAPDPIFAKQMQELIGGQWGEMSVMVNYLFQGWNCRGPAKYRDMLLDTATEELRPRRLPKKAATAGSSERSLAGATPSRPS